MVPFAIECMILYIIRARIYQDNIRSVNSGQGAKQSPGRKGIFGARDTRADKSVVNSIGLFYYISR